MESQSFRLNRGLKVILNSTFHLALLLSPPTPRTTFNSLAQPPGEGLPTAPVSIFNPHGAAPTAIRGHRVGQGGYGFYHGGC